MRLFLPLITPLLEVPSSKSTPYTPHWSVRLFQRGGISVNDSSPATSHESVMRDPSAIRSGRFVFVAYDFFSEHRAELSFGSNRFITLFVPPFCCLTVKTATCCTCSKYTHTASFGSLKPNFSSTKHETLLCQEKARSRSDRRDGP